MRQVNVALGSKNYPVYIGSGLLTRAGGYLKERGFNGRLVVITDSTVKKLYGDMLSQALEGEGFQVDILEVPPGEEQKTLENAGRLYRELTTVHAERSTPVLALGGGVIGDLAGFVAATYQRGVPLVQLPTTLLAQVDSSVGGKVAVDHGQLKNMIGAFYQPEMVIADTNTLPSLPEEELVNGLAEVIKSAAIRDGRFFSFLEESMEKIKSFDVNSLEEVVFQTVGIKAAVVAEDERDMGLRHILNYGHTIGHAVESVSDFRIKHGNAVAIGMVAAARLSHRLGILDGGEVKRLRQLITRAGLPAEIPDLGIEKIMQAMQHDKKVREGRVEFVLLKSIGDTVVTDDVSPSLIREVLAENE
ncbi:MAG: 3-dehydroquinate synthase [Dehalococcoidales bacterium]